MQYKDYLLKKAGDINSILKVCSDDRAAFIFFLILIGTQIEKIQFNA